jgi:fructose-1-phosphate kinase PfkB-like protein
VKPILFLVLSYPRPMAVVPYRPSITGTLTINDNEDQDLEKRVATGDRSGTRNSLMSTSSEGVNTFHDEGWSWASRYRGGGVWERVGLYSSVNEIHEYQL